MNLTLNDKRVLRLIKVGAENSITGAEIILMTKLAERTVQDIISRLITRYGVPIVGVRHGFLEATLSQLTKRSYWTEQRHSITKYKRSRSV